MVNLPVCNSKSNSPNSMMEVIKYFTTVSTIFYYNNLMDTKRFN